ncbi:MAG: hypothetical protein ACE5IL_02540 [Myxococcota bacterium]
MLKHALWTLAALAIGVPLPAGALPVAIDLSMGTNGSFGFSDLHAATGSEILVNGNSYFASGTASMLTGTLFADLQGNVFSGIHGALRYSGALGSGSLTVVGGSLDFGVAPDTMLGSLKTLELGEFFYLNHTFAGTANSFDGQNLRLWGNNWNAITEIAGPTNRFGSDLGGRVRPVPEPTAALVFGVGSLLVSGALRRRSGSP